LIVDEVGFRPLDRQRDPHHRDPRPAAPGASFACSRCPATSSRAGVGREPGDRGDGGAGSPPPGRGPPGGAPAAANRGRMQRLSLLILLPTIRIARAHGPRAPRTSTSWDKRPTAKHP
jgi:hypothetical protein